MNDYEQSKAFWDTMYKEEAPEALSGRIFHSDAFERLLRTGLAEARDVLDYGCGSGWGLFEMYFTVGFEHGLGVDTAENGIRLANECASLSGLSEKLRFIQGDIDLLGRDEYDFILTVNVLDVVPDDACEAILCALFHALRPGRHMLVCLNPEFTKDELTGMLGMEMRGDYCYKNGVLRARIKTREAWRKLFERCFAVEEISNFALAPREEKYPRVAYLLKKPLT